MSREMKLLPSFQDVENREIAHAFEGLDVRITIREGYNEEGERITRAFAYNIPDMIDTYFPMKSTMGVGTTALEAAINSVQKYIAD